MRIKATYTDKHLFRSGVYMGGIGSGGFEIRPDGRFYRCRIFNDWKKEPALDAFFLFKSKEKTNILWLEDLITSARVIEGVKKIEYRGEFPKVELYYPELDVRIECFSFFIPGDIKNSSLPALKFKVKGRGQMIFLLPAHIKCAPVVKGQKIFLKKRNTGLGVYSTNGRIFYAPLTHRILDIFVDIEEFEKRKSDVFTCLNCSALEDYFYAGIYWENEFSDEFVISWYFPEMKDLEENLIGHYYTNFFSSCEDVLNYVIRNIKNLESRTERFYNKIYSAKVPQFLKESYSAQISSFVKESWITKHGKFGVWEGSTCCCGLQTTDVAYYGSWLYAKMFPELEKSGIELTARFQRKDGWIPHFFPGTFKRIDEYRRKDMNMQFTLMVYRDYFLWKDKKFLKSMYPKIKKAISLVYKWDIDGDMIPDIEGPDQTFDLWGWKGCSIYLAVLWLATLRTGQEIGQIFNDKKFSEKCEKDFNIVKENIIKKLWNGEYFILWDNGKEKDEGCLLDALSGDWYCYLTGLGHILPEDMIKSHLKSCLKYNRKKLNPEYMLKYYTPGEKGWCYINGGYKEEKQYCSQQYEPWTGMEYAFAIHLYIMGMRKEALRVVKDVYERKLKCGMVWNHIECGGDYFRPMVIGALWDLIV